MDDAKGFKVAIEKMKERGFWPHVRHLLCRWHVYEAIKRSCNTYFSHLPKGTQLSERNRFITAFKNVVCAPNESQMESLWRSIENDELFPHAAVEWVKKHYYTSPKAR